MVGDVNEGQLGERRMGSGAGLPFGLKPGLRRLACSAKALLHMLQYPIVPRQLSAADRLCHVLSREIRIYSKCSLHRLRSFLNLISDASVLMVSP
jgi:hypothetical protein